MCVLHVHLTKCLLYSSNDRYHNYMYMYVVVQQGGVFWFHHVIDVCVQTAESASIFEWWFSVDIHVICTQQWLM